MTPADALDPVGRLTLYADILATYGNAPVSLPAGLSAAVEADLRAVLRRLEDSEAKLARIANAWHVVGPRPVVHRRAQRDLMSNWPTLAEAIVVAIPALPAAPRPDAGGAG